MSETYSHNVGIYTVPNSLMVIYKSIVDTDHCFKLTKHSSMLSCKHSDVHFSSVPVYVRYCQT